MYVLEVYSLPVSSIRFDLSWLHYAGPFPDMEKSISCPTIPFKLTDCSQGSTLVCNSPDLSELDLFFSGHDDSINAFALIYFAVLAPHELWRTEKLPPSLPFLHESLLFALQ